MYEYWMWAPSFQKSSLESAVADGNGDKDVNRPGIYSGGVVAAFCLDTMIQKQSASRASLEDLLSLMLTRYGLAGKQWTLDNLIRDASEVAGIDLRDFFSRYIAAREHLPVIQCMNDAGFDIAIADYDGIAVIAPQANPQSSARLIRERLALQQMPIVTMPKPKAQQDIKTQD